MIRIASMIAISLLLACAHTHAAGLEKVLVKGGEVLSHVSSGISGHDDAANGREDGAMPEVVASGVATAGTVGYSVVAAKGAGALAGYAGTASAVSSLGLGGVTTAIAGAMGSSATGAAATAVVTAAVGGPVAMGAILVTGSAAVSYGVYKGGQAVWRWLSKSKEDQ